jgi:hypothetical protein
MFKKILAVGLVASCFSFAEESAESTMAVTKHEHPFSIMLEGDAVALKGAGLKTTYKISEKFSLGLNAKKYEITSDSDWSASLNNSYKHEITSYGVVTDFFPMGSVDSRGLYVSAAVTSARVESTVTDNLFGKNSSSDSKVGGQLKVGYQFIIPIGSTANILFQVGGGYGNAGAVNWRVFSGSKTELRDSILLDLNAGAQF